MNASVTALLSAAVWHDEAARRVAVDLPTEVVNGPHSRILEAVQALVTEGVTVDPTTVLARLTRMPGAEDAARALVELVTAGPHVGTVGWHLDQVHEDAARIRLRALGTAVEQAAETEDLHSAVGMLRERFDRVNLGTSTAPPTVADVVDDYLAGLDAHITARVLPTGLLDLDDLLGGGLRDGQLVVVGARPGVGKTVLLGGFACHAALRESARVLLRSLEMSRTEVLTRYVSSETKVPLAHLISQDVTDDDWTSIARRLPALMSGHLHVDDRADLTVAGLHQQARSLRPDLIVVDYLQLIRPGKATGNRQEDVAAMTRALKLMARDLHCPVVIAAQLNRALTDRKDQTPRLSDLRESGAIEADADVVILLDRDPNDDTMGTTARALVEKNRSGPTGRVDLAFHGHYARFEALRWTA